MNESKSNDLIDSSTSAGVKRTADEMSSETSFHDAIGTEMVDLYVGSKGTPYRVHKKILCEKIPYFDKMFNGGFKESLELVARFPEDTPESFDVLISWVYTNRLRSLVDKLGIESLLNEVMDALKLHQDKESEFFTYKDMLQHYQSVPPRSPLRKYVLDCILYNFIGFQAAEDFEDWSVSSLHEIFCEEADLAKEFLSALHALRNAAAPDPAEKDDCTYHSHAMGTRCPGKESK